MIPVLHVAFTYHMEVRRSAICAILFDLEGIGIGGAVVCEVRVGDSAGLGDGCSIRDRAGGRSANRAGRLIGDFATGWHRDGIMDVTDAAAGEPCGAASLSGSVGNAGERAREAIVDDRARNGARS